MFVVKCNSLLSLTLENLISLKRGWDWSLIIFERKDWQTVTNIVSKSSGLSKRFVILLTLFKTLSIRFLSWHRMFPPQAVKQNLRIPIIQPLLYKLIIFIFTWKLFNCLKRYILVFNLLINLLQWERQSSLSSKITPKYYCCVLYPVLFTIYTNECRINEINVKLLKFADDSCIQGFISETSDNLDYKNSVDWFSNWCDINKLLLNTDKTKELVIDHRINKEPIEPLKIKGKAIE